MVGAVHSRLANYEPAAIDPVTDSKNDKYCAVAGTLVDRSSDHCVVPLFDGTNHLIVRKASVRISDWISTARAVQEQFSSSHNS